MWNQLFFPRTIVNPKATAPCTMRTLRKTWKGSARKVEHGQVRRAKENCTVAWRNSKSCIDGQRKTAHHVGKLKWEGRRVYLFLGHDYHAPTHSMDNFAFLSVLLEVIRETIWNTCIHHAAPVDLVICMLTAKMTFLYAFHNMVHGNGFSSMAYIETATQQPTVGGVAWAGMCCVSVNGEIILVPVLKLCLILLFKYSRMKLIPLQASHLDCTET